MQKPLFGPSLSPPTLVYLGLAATVIGLAASWLSARLANGGRPSGRQMAWTIAVTLVMAASAAVARPEHFAWSLGLGAALVILASVDLTALRLPDVLTLPLMGAGLAYALLAGGDPGGHAAGLLAGYGILEGTGWVYARLRGRRGIGLGDAKLFAAAGAWLGWAALPSVMLIACGLGLAWFAVAALRGGRLALQAPAPFGVALCCGTWAIWLLG